VYEVTVPDPLEATVRDRRRMPEGRRRAIELGALAVLVPALLVARWIDDSRLGRSFDRPEHVTVVPRGGTATIGHSRWRLLGRDATRPATSAAPGSARLTLIVQVHVLDAQGVKDATRASYQVRDRKGHVWTALGEFPDFRDPAPGGTVQATVTADVPPKLVTEVVLEVRAGASGQGPVRVLRFAH
jgi:hypothetical protein